MYLPFLILSSLGFARWFFYALSFMSNEAWLINVLVLDIVCVSPKFMIL